MQTKSSSKKPNSNNRTRELDEKAAIQRKREEEAEAKLAAKKAGTRLPERSTAPIRNDSSDRQPGPPRLALAGNKPTWRERKAQKEAEAAGAQVPPSAPSSDVATAEVLPPKKTTGYVPPARRGDAAPRGRPDGETSSAPRDESLGGPDAPTRWRTREHSGRDGSPSADSLPPRFSDSLRRRPEGSSLRDQSPADGPSFSKLGAGLQRDSSIPARSDSPATNAVSTPGKYIPVHLRNKGT